MPFIDDQDYQDLMAAVKKHVAATKELEDVKLFTEEERVDKEIYYYATQHEMDVVCERLGVTYGDDCEVLLDRYGPRAEIGGISD